MQQTSSALTEQLETHLSILYVTIKISTGPYLSQDQHLTSGECNDEQHFKKMNYFTRDFIFTKKDKYTSICFFQH